MKVMQRELRLHVLESNAIEGIHTRTGPLYWRHLAAARAVAANPRQYVYDVAGLHRLMFGGLRHPPQAGRYRSYGAMIVGKDSQHELPPPHELPLLMDAFYRYVKLMRRNRPAYADVLCAHALLLCIHPFTDGNGRVSRLHMNALYLTMGWRWRHITMAQRASYYQFIRSLEQEFFPKFRAYALGKGE